MPNTYTLSDYLLDRLNEAGCRHVFGVPGDFAFPFLDHLDLHGEVAWVGCCSELNASYAADGYARRTGLGAICGSCGVLEMGGASGIAGAFSEFVPMLVISGFPAVTAMVSKTVMHHSLRGSYNAIGLVMAPMTIAQVVVSAANGMHDIDHAIRTCTIGKGPVHLQFPADLQELPTRKASGPLDLCDPTSDPAQLDAFIKKTRAMLANAKSPVILVDYLAARYGLVDLILTFAHDSGIPFSWPIDGVSGGFDQAKPGYLGYYLAPPQEGPATERVEAADVLLRICLGEGDGNRGLAARDRADGRCIDLDPVSARIGATAFLRVAAKDALERLLHGIEQRDGLLPTPPSKPVAFVPRADTGLTHDRAWEALFDFLRAGDTVALDYGTTQNIKLLRPPTSVRLMLQASWDAIGWTTGAMLGDMLAAPGGRFIQIIGDGAFHETGQELSTVLAHGLAPITLVVNNTTYEVENLTHVDGPRTMAYNDMPGWDYVAFARAVAPDTELLGIRVTTESEFADALRRADEAQRAGRFSLIEMVVPPHDSGAALRKLNGVDSEPIDLKHDCTV